MWNMFRSSTHLTDGETPFTVHMSITALAIDPALLSEEEHPKGQACSIKKPFDPWTMKYTLWSGSIGQVLWNLAMSSVIACVPGGAMEI